MTPLRRVRRAARVDQVALPRRVPSSTRGDVASVDSTRGAGRGAKSRRAALSEWTDEDGRLTPGA